MSGDARYVAVYAAQVDDEELYRRYRAQMTPLLHARGGGFRYDFVVRETLISEAKHPINRVFMIGFPSRAVADAFFSDPAYLEVRHALFAPAVSAITQIASYHE